MSYNMYLEKKKLRYWIDVKKKRVRAEKKGMERKPKSSYSS